MACKTLRYLSGFMLLAVILISFYAGRAALFAVSVFFIIIAMIEYRNMFKNKGIYPHKLLPELLGAACAYTFIFIDDLNEQIIITPLMTAGIIMSFVFTIILNKKPYIETSLSSMAAFFLIFCGLYIIKLTYYFQGNIALCPVLIYFSAVLAGDFAASKIGPLYKEKKLASEISPDKTVLGAIAHLFFCSLAACCFVFFTGMNLFECIILGIIISIFAQAGDLAVSSFKRGLGIKHSSGFFYDYGGILDRMDAFIFSAPAAYYCLYFISAF